MVIRISPDRSHGFRDVVLAKAGADKTLFRFKKNGIFYSQDDAAESIFYIRKGEVKLNVTSEHGKEAV
jgi:CRP/FNR family transcriptional regulator, cyclic AMP receptor protein